jgi:hypothetical protein
MVRVRVQRPFRSCEAFAFRGSEGPGPRRVACWSGSGGFFGGWSSLSSRIPFGSSWFTIPRSKVSRRRSVALCPFVAVDPAFSWSQFRVADSATKGRERETRRKRKSRSTALQFPLPCPFATCVRFIFSGCSFPPRGEKRKVRWRDSGHIRKLSRAAGRQDAKPDADPRHVWRELRCALLQTKPLGLGPGIPEDVCPRQNALFAAFFFLLHRFRRCHLYYHEYKMKPVFHVSLRTNMSPCARRREGNTLVALLRLSPTSAFAVPFLKPADPSGGKRRRRRGKRGGRTATRHAGSRERGSIGAEPVLAT